MIAAVGPQGERLSFPDDASFVRWITEGNHRPGVIRAFSLSVLDGGADALAATARPGFPPPALPSTLATGEAAVGSTLPASVASPVVPSSIPGER